MTSRARTFIWSGLVGLLVAASIVSAPGGSGEAGTGGSPSEASGHAVHFTASGDFSSSDEAASVLDQVGRIQPDLHVALGDLSYGRAGEEAKWCGFVTGRAGKVPFEIVSGNHESNGVNGHIDAFAACLPNRLPGLVGSYGRQYYVDVPQDDPVVRFVLISPALTFDDGSWSYAEGTPRYRWTENAIDSARASGVPWVVVGMHKPCLSVGQYGCDPGPDILNLLLKKRVDLVLSGHEHLYARSQQLALSTSCPEVIPGEYSARCVADDDTQMVKGAGTVFAIAGTGGMPLRRVNSDDAEAPYFTSTSGSNRDPSWGNLEVSATATALDARFRTAAGDGFSDSFSIARRDATQPDLLARDAFSRHTFDGFGTADVGGSWSVAGNASRYSVDGSGHITLSPNGAHREAYLGDVSSTATDVRVTLSANRWTPVGASVGVSGRRIAGAGAYEAKLMITESQRLELSLVRVGPTGDSEIVLLGPALVPRLTPTVDEGIEVRVQVVGTHPTVVRAKAWATGAPQPPTWLRAFRDDTPSLQGPGAVGIRAQAMDMAGMAPGVVNVDNLRAGVP